MKHSKLSLQINEPCSENWETMSPQEQGRFCSSCSKIVMDFTVMTEKQILAFFKNYSGEVCGRMHHHQMEYTYALTRKTSGFIHYFLQFALSGLLTLKIADSAAGDSVPKTEQATIHTKEKTKQLYYGKEEGKPVIKGKVILVSDTNLQNPTTIRIKETGQSFQADSTGAFTFELPKTFKGKQVTLTFSHEGYESVNYLISVAQLPLTNLVVRLYDHKNIKMGKIRYRNN